MLALLRHGLKICILAALVAPSAGMRLGGLPARPVAQRVGPVRLASSAAAIVTIEYCTGCNWMLRSAWLQQELLTTFDGTLTAVMLRPNHAGAGVFHVSLDTETAEERVLWSRPAEGRFPETKELKQRLRDQIDPGRDLGHSDAAASPAEAGEAAEGEGGGSVQGSDTAPTALQRIVSVLRLDRLLRKDERPPPPEL